MRQLNWKKLPPSLLLALLLTACSQSTEVHLYGRYLSEAQSNSMRQALKAQGFKVQVNQLAFPQNINQSALIYGMPLSRPDEVEQIRLIAKTQGFQLGDMHSLVQGNHWYSGNSMGLILLPDGVSPNQLHAAQDLSFVYQSQGCNEQVELSLTADQRFAIKPAKGAVHDSGMLQGHWRVKQLPYLELQPQGNPDWAYYLEISRNQSRDLVGLVQQLNLTPLQTYPVFGGCSFVYGVRVAR